MPEEHLLTVKIPSLRPQLPGYCRRVLSEPLNTLRVVIHYPGEYFEPLITW